MSHSIKYSVDVKADYFSFFLVVSDKYTPAPAIQIDYSEEGSRSTSRRPRPPQSDGLPVERIYIEELRNTRYQSWAMLT